MEGKTCCVTGHRDLPQKEIGRVKAALRREIDSAVADGFTRFMSGFADGVDQYFAEIVLEKKKTNPAADKIMNICNVLQITPEQLLTGKGIEDEEEIAAASPESRFTPYDIQLIEDFHGLKEEQQKRLMAYVEALKKIESLENM